MRGAEVFVVALNCRPRLDSKTRPWVIYGEGPSQLPRSQLNDLKSPMTSKDIRFTIKNTVLYAFVLGLPKETIAIKSLASGKIASLTLLGSNAKLDWKQTVEALEIQPVAKWPCQHAVVFKIMLKQ